MKRVRAFALVTVTVCALPVVQPAPVAAAEPRLNASIPVVPGRGSLADLIERALPSVVTIRVSGEAPVPVPLDPDGDGTPAKARPFRSGGSGVIVNAALGLIATNYHVVRDATQIDISLNDGREAEAKLIGVDLGTDVAMLQVSLDRLTSMPFGDSSRLRVGDGVVAIGNPFGLEGSASAGIISGLDRTGVGYDLYESFIQVDAPINPGNSGGALINFDGELIGINTAIGNHRNGAAGIGFAIPINVAHRVGYQLVKHGRMRRGTIGLDVIDISSSLAHRHNLPNKRGALISRVASGSPADLAGVRPYSTIVAVNDAPVRNGRDFIAHFGSAVVGDELDIQLVTARGNSRIRLTVSDQITDHPALPISGEVPGIGGLVVTSIPTRSHLFGQMRGAIVTAVEPGSPAFRAGFRPSDLIVAIDDITISDASQIVELAQSPATHARVRISRSAKPYIISLRSR